ncbi:MAG TPA: transaldolase [Kiritimatiellia bacterium]|nr:transaldolase [Kiritimatiellia bacterium]HMO98295.1 transaldolase [Kiritimatiellia bacterium]
MSYQSERFESNAVPSLKDLKVKIFSDGADLDSITEAYQKGIVKGFTTNPTLMAKAGVINYLTFAREFLRIVPDLPVSFEVFSDDLEGMKRQALVLNDLAENVYVKIPITNTQGVSCAPLIHELSAKGLKLNITAMMTTRQVQEVIDALVPDSLSFISVFAGRIADSGRDPLPVMIQSLEIIKARPGAELIWASPRESFNIIQADQIGCHIITVTPALLDKAPSFGKNLDEFSLDTVKMFYNDATKSGFHI